MLQNTIALFLSKARGPDYGRAIAFAQALQSYEHHGKLLHVLIALPIREHSRKDLDRLTEAGISYRDLGFVSVSAKHMHASTAVRDRPDWALYPRSHYAQPIDNANGFD